MKQTVLTFITTIDPAKRTELDRILGLISLDLYTNAYVPFPSLSLLHFASFVIIDNNDAALLVFENNFDGNLDHYLDQLAQVAGDGLHQIYRCCVDYSPTDFNAGTLKLYLAGKVVKPNAYHIGNVGRMAQTVKQNRQLREGLEVFLDDLLKDKSTVKFSAAEVRQNIQKFTEHQLPPELSAQLPPHQTFLEKLVPWINVVIIGVLGIAAAIILFPLLIVAVIVLRRKEETDFIETTPLSVKNIDQLISLENKITQNHLASVTMVKSGWFRLTLLKGVLFAANLLARTANKGKLSGIPTLHFAHWSVINNGTQLLFLSNFDGSWSSYLDDFIDKAARGLTAIWTNTQGFPYTRFLVKDGARDELRFKAYARNHQAPSLVWYSAYTDLTVQNIDKDSAIREQVLTPLTDTDTQKWLQLF